MKFIVQEEEREYEFLLSPGLYIVGRDPTCDLSLDSKRVSRRHMSCTVTGDEVRVKDLGSRNGIRLDGEKTKEAVLTDGNELDLGDVHLVFKDSASAGGAGAASVPESVTGEPTIEDDEQTPPDGSLVPREELAANAQVTKRDGEWYVTDPETGRQMQIVPAEEEEQEQKSLLHTRKGRFIIGSLAAGVVVLFLMAALFGGGGEQTTNSSMSARQYEALLGETLEALNRGETERARELAERARAARPESEAAEILMELTRIWDDWQEDFFGHWMKVKRLTEALYRNYDSRQIESFVKEYRDWIKKELRYSEMAEKARAAYQAGNYEDAWKLLQDIPRGSPVRERDQELFSRVRADLRKHLRDQVHSQARRQNWEQARQAARKLVSYYPETRTQMQQELEKYDRYAQHARRVRTARQAIETENYETAMEQLGNIPATSPYQSEAERLRQRAEARGKFKQATRLYNEGETEEAIRLLEQLEVSGASSLRRHVQKVVETYSAAREAEQEQNLARAQQHWEKVMELETDQDNFFRQEAREALSDMSQRRKELARQLLSEAQKVYRAGEYEKCRSLAEQAAQVDPDGEIGAEQLDRLQRQGRMDYRRALNMTDKNPKEALHLFTRATKLLAPDDKYYTWALDEKRELERELKAR